MELKNLLAVTVGLVAYLVLAAESQTLPQFPLGPTATAQKRFGKGKGGGGGGEDHGEPPSLPGGFGMYPLWKFHKFDGFSLRPVPIQLDIGHGIPPPPPTVMPDYQPQSYGGQPSYGGGSSYPAPAPAAAPSSGYAPPGGYGQKSSGYTMPQSSGYQAPSAGYQQPQQSGGYQQEYQPQQSAGYQPQYQMQQNSGYQQPAYQNPITMGYQPMKSYSAPASYGQQSYAPSQPSYTPQQSYAPSQSYGPPAQAAPAPYSSEMSYGASNTQAVSVPGGFTAPQVPSYAAFDGAVPFGGVSDLSLSMDPNQGYMKRFYNTEDETAKSQQSTGNSEKSSEKST